MNISHCNTCRWFRQGLYGTGFCSSSAAHAGAAVVTVRADFGCVHHEHRPEVPADLVVEPDDWMDGGTVDTRRN